MTQEITSPSNPRVKRALKLRKARERRRSGLLLAEGDREIGRAVACGLVVDTLFVGEAVADRVPGWLGSIPPSRVCRVPMSLLTRMTYRDDPEGWLAVVEQPTWGLAALEPGGPSGEGAMDLATEGSVLLVAVGTEKPGNLGAMVRTADAAGCVGVLAVGGGRRVDRGGGRVGTGDDGGGGDDGGNGSDGGVSGPVERFNPNTIRASTGAVFGLPVVNLAEAEAMAWLVDRGYRVLCAMVDGEVGLHESVDALWRPPVAVVIGPEDAGLSANWRETASRSGGACVRIDMRGRVADSLNASASAALMVYEAVRRGGAGA